MTKLSTYPARKSSPAPGISLALTLAIVFAAIAFLGGRHSGAVEADKANELTAKATAEAKKAQRRAAIAVGEAEGWQQIAREATATAQETSAALEAVSDELSETRIKLEDEQAVVRQLRAQLRQLQADSPQSLSRSGWNTARVSWYGPGFYGHTMAGGGQLQRDSMVVAHRSLPFGTRVQLVYGGRSTTAVVRDRGPFISGRTFDLGPGTARALGFSGVGTVRWRVVS